MDCEYRAVVNIALSIKVRCHYVDCVTTPVTRFSSSVYRYSSDETLFLSRKMAQRVCAFFNCYSLIFSNIVNIVFKEIHSISGDVCPHLRINLSVFSKAGTVVYGNMVGSCFMSGTTGWSRSIMTASVPHTDADVGAEYENSILGDRNRTAVGGVAKEIEQ